MAGSGAGSGLRTACLSAALLAGSVSFAQAAERLIPQEPPATALWLILAVVVLLSVTMVQRRWWMPLLLWVPVAFAASTLIADLLDPVIGPALREELGFAYVMQAELWAALVVALPLAFANLRFERSE